MACVRIDDADDPQLIDYRNLPQSGLRPTGKFIAEGHVLVHRLLDSSLVTDSVLCSEQHYPTIRPLVPASLPVYVARASLLDSIVGFQFHRGVLACGQRPRDAKLSDLVPAAGDPRLVVVCPNVADPTNLAGVIRNSVAFGADGLLLGPGCADPYSRRAVRVSMGTVFQLPIRVAEQLEKELTYLQQSQFHLVATVLSDTATPVYKARVAPRLALLLGGEGFGLDDACQRLCDEHITLPMPDHVDSLNLATASGVFLYHYTHVARRCPDLQRAIPSVDQISS